MSPDEKPTDTESKDVNAVDETPVVVATSTPVTPTVAEALPVHKENSAGTIVLQWLTYAFWGWTILIAAYLVAIITGYTLYDKATLVVPEPIAYGIAAACILLPVSLICDFFYSRQEPLHKKGASMVIMVIHAVLFALFAIASLIAIAFSVVSMFLSSGNHTGQTVALVTAGVGFVLYVLTLGRTAKPMIVSKYRLIFRIVMTVLIAGVSLWGILGPITAAARTKDDRAVSANITSVNTAIESYASTKGTLPNNINQATAGRPDSAYNDQKTIKDLVARGLITYTPNTKSASNEDLDALEQQPGRTFYYELCAVYKYDASTANDYPDSNYYNGSDISRSDAEGYMTYFSTSTHTAGKNCYKLKTTDYSYQAN